MTPVTVTSPPGARPRRMRAMALALAVLLLALPAGRALGAVSPKGAEQAESAVPATDPAARCRAAAEAAARRHGVPPALLEAIALVESGRRGGGGVEPWPWTLNIAGRGFWFESRAEALARVRAELAAGRRSVDLGCFQINFRWHGEHFADPAEMLDPEASADYAARHLARLGRKSGDWMRAAAHYHSRTPHLAARYRARVAAMLRRLVGPAALAAPEPEGDGHARSLAAGGTPVPSAPPAQPDRPAVPSARSPGEGGDRHRRRARESRGALFASRDRPTPLLTGSRRRQAPSVTAIPRAARLDVASAAPAAAGGVPLVMLGAAARPLVAGQGG